MTELIKKFLLIVCLVGMVTNFGTPARAEGPVGATPKDPTTTKILDTTKKVEQAQKDPTFVLGWLVMAAGSYSVRTFKEVFKTWPDIKKKLKAEEDRLQKELEQYGEMSVAQQAALDDHRAQINALVEQLVHDEDAINKAKEERRLHIAKLEGSLAMTLPHDPSEFMAWWDGEDGVAAKQLDPTWYPVYKRLRKAELAAQESMENHFTQLLYHATNLQRAVYDTRVELRRRSNPDHTQPPIGPQQELFVRLEKEPENPGMFNYSQGIMVGKQVAARDVHRLGTAIADNCDSAAATLSSDLVREGERLEAFKKKNIDEAAAALKKHRRQIMNGAVTGIFALLGGGHMLYHLVTTPVPKAPPPSLPDELSSEGGKLALRPFTNIVEAKLREHRGTIYGDLKARLLPEEKQALHVDEEAQGQKLPEGVVGLKQKVEVLGGKSPKLLEQLHNAIHQSIRKVAPDRITERDVFAELMKLLNLGDLSSLTKEDQDARLSNLHSFLTPFYTQTLNTSLKGVTFEPIEATQRINVNTVEKMVSETIEALKTAEWEYKEPLRPGSGTPAFPIVPLPPAHDVKTSGAASEGKSSTSSTVKPSTTGAIESASPDKSSTTIHSTAAPSSNSSTPPTGAATGSMMSITMGSGTKKQELLNERLSSGQLPHD